MSRNKLISFLMETPYPDDSDDDSSDNDTWIESSPSSHSSLSDIFIESVVDDGDDELFAPLILYLVTGNRKERAENYLSVIKSWSDIKFKEHFRLSRSTAYHLIRELERSSFIPDNKFGKKPISAEISFFIFLSFMANTRPLRVIADTFEISNSSTFRVIRRVTKWVLTKLDDVIKWPQTDHDILRTCEGFRSKKNIPKILGVIDCTHISIVKPSGNLKEFFNRKKYYSIVLQAVVDSNMKFTNIYCGEPGSLTDANVLQRSPLYTDACNNKYVFPDNTFLIGDSAYPSLSWLVPPFCGNDYLTQQQREFNDLHSSTRATVAKAFALLKSRFQRIKFFSEYRQIFFISEIVTASCILHNYCIDHDDYFNEIEDDISIGNSLEQENYEEEDLNWNCEGDRRMELFQELFPGPKLNITV